MNEVLAQLDLNKILLESINDAILSVDKNTNIIFLNSEFERKFSEDKKESPSKLSDVISNEEILDGFQFCINESVPFRIEDYEITYKNRKHFYDIVITPMMDKGQCFGAMGVFRNITAAKLSEQMRVDFVANVSHEIRTPLTSIKGFAQVLENSTELVLPAGKEYLSKIIKNTERLHALFSDLLNLSMIESRHRLIKSEINLKAMIESVRAMLLQNYSHKNIQISYDLPIETLRVDPKLFEQALINLIDNACKYAGEKPHIKITSFQEKEDIIISVSDDGPGISREHMGRIFERFYQVESSRTNQKSSRGTGLGLSIVKHIVSKHKGEIWVESEEDKGTIFFIKIPTKNKRISLDE